MPTPSLWPPLGVIRATFEPEARAASAEAVIAPPGAALTVDPTHDLGLPLAELARRREAVAQRAFPARWAPGRLVSVVHEGRLLGMLLDKCAPDGPSGEIWHGWLAASEADWAGAFDVLLEPEDEPFEPMFGLIQTWNAVRLVPSPQLAARVLGEVSATRLAAIRAVHDEWAAQAGPAIAPAPGRIALRSVGGVFSVLSGTPLADSGDPRTEYQALYREAAARLNVLQPAAAEPPRALAQAGDAGSGWARVRRWFSADALLRPAFALLALVVVVQNSGLLRTGGGEDEVRFRSVPPAATAPAPADLVVRWKPGVDMQASAELLRSVSAEVVAGPDAQGGWHLKLADPVQGLATLSASPLVQSVGPP